MRILLLTTRFCPFVGGVEDVVKNLLINFDRKKNEVFIISTLDHSLYKSLFLRIFSVCKTEKIPTGEKVQRIWMGLPSSLLGWILFPYRFVIASISLIFYVRRIRPEIINYHFPDHSSLYIFVLLLFNPKIRLITNLHGNDLQIFGRKIIFKSIIKFILYKSEKIILNSEYMKNECTRDFPQFNNKLIVIPNGIDVTFINSVQPKYFTDKDYVFFVGRFVKKKGIDLLINAFNLLKVKDLHLVLEGYGEEYENIKNLILKLGLVDKIHLTEGALTNTEKFAVMKGAKFGVIPSRIEPFGIVALEFLAAGVPIVASNVGGLSWLLQDNLDVLFFKTENVADLAKKMETLNNDFKLRRNLANNGKAKVKNFDWEEIGAKYLDVFKQYNSNIN